MNKVVLVTGSSRGIGAQTAIEFAKNGYDVVINYKEDKESAERLKNYIEKEYDNKTIALQCDVSNEDDVRDMVRVAYKTFERIDVLVNNAGIAIDTLFEDKTKENFKKVLDTNLIGTFLVSKYVGAIMLEKRCGKIINISSTNGIDTYYEEGLDYDASKAGIISLTHNLAKHYAPYINVNCICPGWTDTDMNKDMDPELVKQEKEKIFLQRFATPEEIAKVIYFVASEGGSYINNAVIRVDGGC
jgi:3-oxoacyl-[acyl-carrier protein] reductase